MFALALSAQLTLGELLRLAPQEKSNRLPFHKDLWDALTLASALGNDLRGMQAVRARTVFSCLVTCMSPRRSLALAMLTQIVV